MHLWAPSACIAAAVAGGGSGARARKGVVGGQGGQRSAADHGPRHWGADMDRREKDRRAVFTECRVWEFCSQSVGSGSVESGFGCCARCLYDNALRDLRQQRAANQSSGVHLLQAAGGAHLPLRSVVYGQPDAPAQITTGREPPSVAGGAGLSARPRWFRNGPHNRHAYALRDRVGSAGPSCGGAHQSCAKELSAALSPNSW